MSVSCADSELARSGMPREHGISTLARWESGRFTQYLGFDAPPARWLTFQDKAPYHRPLSRSTFPLPNSS